MSITMIILIVLAVIVLFFLLSGVGIYNHLITLKNRFTNGFAQIDVQLQRRYDLIPNLVETAKSYMQYEQNTLKSIIEARNSAKDSATASAKNPSDPKAMAELNTAETTLTASLGKFFALVENYPDLKANQTMQDLMEELTTTENRIGFARQAFNDAVMAYNTYRQQFPKNIVAGIFSFDAATYFTVSQPVAREPVRISFG